MKVYSVIVDTDNFNSGLMGVFSPFTKALDAVVDFIKMQSVNNTCQSVGIIASCLDSPISEDNKGVFFGLNYYDRHIVNNEIVYYFKVLIRYPEDNQDIIKILKEDKYPFNVSFKPWE